ncbi:NERD domain-containing protein [Nocardia abscessus]|uniref:NERD domain-containing protein n=1 Tax=Nocardia abscessus TaxID=120957 RepID=UPI001894BB8A|nr:NERD domain-containing protein [Nocardia abscessus]MBF6337223.1 NERD domain-containing protein [Nocardia abscessus]
MLVINERTTAPRSEQRVLNWMRTWTGQYVIVGLAISGCYLPERDRKDETQEADLVVITPRAAVVIEVKGAVPEATTGVLSVQANGRWRLSGFAGDPIHVRDNDSSPFDQVTSNVFNLKALVRKHNAEAFVDGLIVVVPPENSNLTLNVESRRRGCAVVLGTTPVDLRAWFHRTASRKLIWTAERTHALLTDLNLGDQVTVDDLVADGFPPEQKLRAGTLAALDTVTRKPRPDGGRSAAAEIISDTDDMSESSEAPSAELAPEPSDVVPVAARLTASSSKRSSGANDGPVEVGQLATESDRSMPPLSAMPVRTRTDDAEPDAAGFDISESEESEPEPSRRSGAESEQRADGFSSTDPQPLEYVDVSDDIRVVYAAESRPAQDAPAARVVQTRPAEPDPFAPEFLAPEPAAFEPESASATAHPDPGGRALTHHAPPSPGYAQSRDSAEEPEVDGAEWASKPPRSEGRLAVRPAREEIAEPEDHAPERFTTEHVASKRAAAAAPTGPERTEPEPSPAGEGLDPVARSAPSSFTDNWSSWIEPAPDRPLRPRPAPAPLPSRPASWSTPSPEPQPLRRPTPTAVIERRPRIADLRRITALPARAAEKPQLRGHRSQQIAAVALIVLVIGTIWILAASCSTPTGGAVQQPQAPVPTTEAVPPPPPVTETPGRMNLLPLCSPLDPKC